MIVFTNLTNEIGQLDEINKADKISKNSLHHKITELHHICNETFKELSDEVKVSKKIIEN